jgi:hypothetical protein
MDITPRGSRRAPRGWTHPPRDGRRRQRFAPHLSPHVPIPSGAFYREEVGPGDFVEVVDGEGDEELCGRGNTAAERLRALLRMPLWGDVKNEVERTIHAMGARGGRSVDWGKDGERGRGADAATRHIPGLSGSESKGSEGGEDEEAGASRGGGVGGVEAAAVPIVWGADGRSLAIGPWGGARRAADVERELEAALRPDDLVPLSKVLETAMLWVGPVWTAGVMLACGSRLQSAMLETMWTDLQSGAARADNSAEGALDAARAVLEDIRAVKALPVSELLMQAWSVAHDEHWVSVQRLLSCVCPLWIEHARNAPRELLEGLSAADPAFELAAGRRALSASAPLLRPLPMDGTRVELPAAEDVSAGGSHVLYDIFLISSPSAANTPLSSPLHGILQLMAQSDGALRLTADAARHGDRALATALFAALEEFTVAFTIAGGSQGTESHPQATQDLLSLFATTRTSSDLIYVLPHHEPTSESSTHTLGHLFELVSHEPYVGGPKRPALRLEWSVRACFPLNAECRSSPVDLATLLAERQARSVVHARVRFPSTAAYFARVVQVCNHYNTGAKARGCDSRHFATDLLAALLAH